MAEKIALLKSYLQTPEHQNHHDEAEDLAADCEAKLKASEKIKAEKARISREKVAAEQAEKERIAKENAEAERKRLAALPKNGDTRRDIPDAPEMVFIKGGTFKMGSEEGWDREKPVHDVHLNDFWLGKYAVTFEEYDRFCTDTKREKPDDWGWGRDRRPVISIDHDDATSYCAWLSQKTGQCYRLPTEAEWEYAAREGGKNVRFGNGRDIADPAELNFNGSTGYQKTHSKAGLYRAKTVPVGSLNSPNAFGLHDMSGNVWEWCGDRYEGKYYENFSSSAAQNPTGPANGERRVLRGGSWGDSPENCRSAVRNFYGPADRANNTGFRLARTVTL